MVLKQLNKAKKGLKKNLKSPTKTVKKYGKVTAAVAGTAGFYALGYEAFRGLLRTMTPTQAVSFENFITNTDRGLVVQTLALGGAAGLSASVLKSTKLLNRNEATMAVAAGTGLAVGRMLSGLASGDIGKRFQTLLDGEVGLTAFPQPGPTLSTPANTWALNQVATPNATGANGVLPGGRLHPGFSINSPYMDSVIERRNPTLQQTGPYL
tara:strand:+ start:1547 stop:2176 length:630 start_codon:yes stop_codon:yes gene_type:complete